MIGIENFFTRWAMADVMDRDKTIHVEVMGINTDHDIPSYTTDANDAVRVLEYFRKHIENHHSCWDAFCSVVDAGRTQEMREAQLGWGAWFFLFADIPETICKGCLYAVLMERRERKILDERIG